MLVISVCNNEVIFLKTPGITYATYAQGSTVTKNFYTTFQGLFAYSPVNTVNPLCGTVAFEVYKDSALTQKWEGSPYVTGSTDPNFNPNQDAPVVTTAIAEETVYIKGFLLGRTQSVTK